jgi:caffeoyl-CoA O-methyltransferase
MAMPDITDPAIERYATEHSSPEPDHLVTHAEATREAFPSAHQMMVGRLEGRLLKMLVAAVQAHRVLEIGTFTGYSALSMAEALPPGGRIVTCELDEARADIARRAFERAGYGDVIEVHVGPALETLRELEGPFDLCFIDADKKGYPDYYEAVLGKLSDHGLIAIDNVLQGGRILDPDTSNSDTRVMQAFNDRVASDPRVECVMLPVRDGVTLVRRIA